MAKKSKYGPLNELLDIRVVFLSLLNFFIVSSLSLYLFFPATNHAGTNSSESAVIPNSTNKVLGQTEEAQLFIATGPRSYATQRGGVIAMASTEEPSLGVGSYYKGGEAQISLYQSTYEDLVSFLVHDKEYKQIQKNINTDRYHLVHSSKLQIEGGYGKSSKVILPLEPEGIYFLRISLDKSIINSFILRSKIASLVKEGDNELIFWGQDLVTGKSLSEGTVKIISLENSQKIVLNGNFNSQGVSKLPFSPDADIALIEHGSSLALIPINLRYLNSGNYKMFRQKEINTKYFIFTDRPLYKPGDKVYFKAVLREDDDARYSITVGNAKVTVYKDWDEKQAIYDKILQISEDGTVYGEVQIPRDSTPGDYQLKVSTTKPKSEFTWEENTISFQVEYYRKPEYYLDLAAPKSEYVAGDKAEVSISGNYFSGQPLSDAEVTYSITSSDFYEYEYLADNSYVTSDDFRWGAWNSSRIKDGTVMLDSAGHATLEFDTVIPGEKARSQVYSVEITYKDDSGNQVISRKNILVYSGEYGIYQKDYSYGGKVDSVLKLPVVIYPHRTVKLSDVQLTADIHYRYWQRIQNPREKYPSYQEVDENLPALSQNTDSSGNAIFSFTPQKPGSYEWTVKGKDSKGNTIKKTFYSWVAKEGEPYYISANENQLTVKSDKTKYNAGDTATLTIFSEAGDRDIFLSLERERVNRYQVIHMVGKSMKVNVPLVDTDIPNIFASVSGFSSDSLNTGNVNLPISTDTRQMVINITPDKKTYGAGENVELNIQTQDTKGNPLPGDLAVYAVDKALFELTDERPEKILDSFWYARGDNTIGSDSLIGIGIEEGGGAGGCFAQGTKVTMKDGKEKNIEDVKAGDQILTKKTASESQLVSAVVKSIHKTVSSGLLIINGKLKVTPNHILWVNNNWQQAGSIQPGDTLISIDNQHIRVDSIEWQEGNFPVYNLEIEKYRTYIADGFWVHNEKGGGGRTVFKDTAYWNPNVKTDSSGRAKIRFQLPDNLTTWLIAAVGETYDTKVGQTTGEISVTKDIIIRPVLPNILRVGDNARIEAYVQNFSRSDQSFNVSLQFDSGVVAQSSYSGILIKSNESKTLYWNITPQNENEKAALKFTAQSVSDPKANDSMTAELPVRVFGFWENRAETGYNDKNYQIRLSSDSINEKSQISLSLSPTMLGALPEAVSYLLYYPYGCVEQTTSSLVPLIIAKTNPDIFAKITEGKNIDDMIKKGLDRLEALQHSDGGWSWWFDPVSDVYTSSYVAEYLVLARESGITVSDKLIDGARKFFETSPVNASSPNKDEYIMKVYALSLIGGQKSIPALILNLNSLTPDIVAIAALTNIRNGYTDPDVSGLNTLIGLGKAQGDGMYWESGNKLHFGSVDTSTSLAVRALLASGKAMRETAVKGAMYLIRNRKSSYWSNTFGTSQVVRAMTQLAKSEKELSPDYLLNISLDGKVLTKEQVTGNTKIKDIVIPAKNILNSGSLLAITKTGQGQVYSTLSVKEFHTDTNAKSSSHGLILKREYHNSLGGNQIKVGDEVTVNIKLSGLNATENYGVIEDILPGGLVPINYNLKNETDNNSTFGSWSYGQEVRENGMVLSLYSVYKGEKVYTYKARAISEGKFLAPPAEGQLMYAPEIYGRSDVQTVSILDKSSITDKAPSLSPAETLKPVVTKQTKIAGIAGLVRIIFTVIIIIIGIFLIYFALKKLL